MNLKIGEAASPTFQQPLALLSDCHRRVERFLDLLRRVADEAEALEVFLADYSAGRTVGRYVAASLPELPFPDQSFGLALCSHLLFLYSELLSETFHRAAIRELCRVAREVRLFPILTLAGTPSPHLDAVCATAFALGWQSELRTVDYELQRGGNQMLRIWRPAS